MLVRYVPGRRASAPMPAWWVFALRIAVAMMTVVPGLSYLVRWGRALGRSEQAL